MTLLILLEILIIFSGSCHSQPASFESRVSSDTAPKVNYLCTDSALTKEDRIFGLVTIYSTVKQHFPYFEQVSDLDWDQAFKEYLPLVEKQQSLFQYYRTLQRFTALLEDGHTRVWPPEQLQRQMDNLPFTLDYIEDQWVVIERWPTKEIIEEDIPLGTVVLSINDVSASQYFQENLFPYIGEGARQAKRNAVSWRKLFPKDTKLTLRLRYPDGTIKTRIIKPSRESANWTPQLRTRYMSDLQKGPYFSKKKLDGHYLYVRYRSCQPSCEEQFVSLIESMDSTNKPRALILDLRNNGGGSSPMNAVKHLISEPVDYCPYRTRCSISFFEAHLQMARKQGWSEEEFINAARQEMGELLPKGYSPGWLFLNPSDSNIRLKPEEKKYAGPLVILINSWTASAAEGFAVLLHAAGRATIVGEPSTGSTGQLMYVGLPGGGTLEICSVYVTYPDGQKFVGIGIQPDIYVTRTIKGIAEERDEILEAALAFLRESEPDKVTDP